MHCALRLWSVQRMIQTTPKTIYCAGHVFYSLQQTHHNPIRGAEGAKTADPFTSVSLEYSYRESVCDTVVWSVHATMMRWMSSHAIVATPSDRSYMPSTTQVPAQLPQKTTNVALLTAPALRLCGQSTTEPQTRPVHRPCRQRVADSL